jgi:DNA invertase Pin-like site-specific DNA recombinase
MLYFRASRVARKIVKAIGYARVVPGENTTDALSHQKARITEYCRSNGLNLEKIHEEIVSSELSLNEGRPELLAALNALGSGDALVVVRTDRLSQNRQFIAELKNQIEKTGCVVHTMQGPTDLTKVKSGIEVTSM